MAFETNPSTPSDYTILWSFALTSVNFRGVLLFLVHLVIPIALTLFLLIFHKIYLPLPWSAQGIVYVCKFMNKIYIPNRNQVFYSS